MQSGSKTESQYDDDFDSISKSHMSHSRGGKDRNNSFSTTFEAQHINKDTSTPVAKKPTPDPHMKQGAVTGGEDKKAAAKSASPGAKSLT